MARAHDADPVVAVALSGGVDSAVAAARLQAEGHRLVGITARLLPDALHGPRGCCDEQRARELCALLGVEHHVSDLTTEFEQAVVEPFIRGCTQGLTPNPCVQCNRAVKFGALLERARALGCSALATGHYACGERREGRWCLRRATASDKDQSYMLQGLTQAQLAAAWFPLGDVSKAEVVAEARRLRLPHAPRESQDLCFITEGLPRFMAAHVALEPGPIIDCRGRRLGVHRGLALYTVGQRRGLAIGGTPRLYVLALDPARNALVVGERRPLVRSRFTVRDVNWVSMAPPARGTVTACLVVVRYRGRPIRGSVTAGPAGTCEVSLDAHDQAVAPGQSAALYDDDGQLLGGGVIAAEDTAWGPETSPQFR